MEDLSVMEHTVLPQVWAVGEDGGMADFGGGDDTGGADILEDAGGDAGEIEEDEGAEAEDGEGSEEGDEKGDGRRGSKEFRQALKNFEATPEGAKFAKQVRADYYGMQQMREMYPGGLTEIREQHELVQRIGGAEGLATLQERVAGADAIDQALLSGDAKTVLEQLGKEFDGGLAKLTGPLLDRAMQSDPQAYAAAVLPHMMGALAGSAMVKDLNTMVDVMQAPHLDDAGKLKQIVGLLGRVGAWFEHNEKRAGEMRKAPEARDASELDTKRAEIDQKEQQLHWKTNINPTVAAHETSRINEALRPFEAKLKHVLDKDSRTALIGDIKARLGAAAKQDAAFTRQMKIYRGQKNPDAKAVSSFVNSATNRLVKAAVEGAVKQRYGRVLGSAGTVQPKKVQPGARTTPPAGAGTKPLVVVATRPTPDQIDYKKTSENDQWKGIFTLKDGRRVQVRKAN